MYLKFIKGRTKPFVQDDDGPIEMDPLFVGPLNINFLYGETQIWDANWENFQNLPNVNDEDLFFQNVYWADIEVVASRPRNKKAIPVAELFAQLELNSLKKQQVEAADWLARLMGAGNSAREALVEQFPGPVPVYKVTLKWEWAIHPISAIAYSKEAARVRAMIRSIEACPIPLD